MAAAAKHVPGMPKLLCCLLQVFSSTLAGPTLPLVPQGLFLQTAALAIGASSQGFGHLFWNRPQMPLPEKGTAHLHAGPREWLSRIFLAQLSATASSGLFCRGCPTLEALRPIAI